MYAIAMHTIHTYMQEGPGVHYTYVSHLPCEFSQVSVGREPRRWTDNIASLAVPGTASRDLAAPRERRKRSILRAIQRRHAVLVHAVTRLSLTVTLARCESSCRPHSQLQGPFRPHDKLERRPVYRTRDAP